MKRLTVALLVVTCLMLNGCNDGSAGDPETALPRSTYGIGGKTISLPLPHADMTELDRDQRAFFKDDVPPEARLISGYALTDELDLIESGDSNVVLTRYAMAFTVREAETMDCTATVFKQAVKGFRQSMNENVDETLEYAQRTLDERTDLLEEGELPFEVGKPTPLGCFFSKRNACAYGLVTTVSQGDVEIPVAVASVILRVNNRMLAVAIYAQDHEKETIDWLRKTSEEWTDAILAAN